PTARSMQRPQPTEAPDIGAAVSESRSLVGAGCSADSWRLVAERGVSLGKLSVLVTVCRADVEVHPQLGRLAARRGVEHDRRLQPAEPGARWADLEAA